MNQYDVIVVGAGHAGIEACLATSRLGLNTLIVTTNTDRIGYMSCNPSIGGLAKGHMVRELDILGGQMGVAADKTCIQYKRLNSSKGPAVRGTRVQNDKHEYNKFMTETLTSEKNLTVRQGEVKRLLLNGNICEGVVLDDGSEVRSKAVVITAGTFMNGVMHIGLEQSPGGRVGDKASVGLSDQLKEFGFNVQRLKTGTPPRLLKESIDWSKTAPQFGDEHFFPFSLRSKDKFELEQVACHLTRTTAETHEIIRSNLDKSPLFCGIIEGVGPRYCPSIEDKITRFAERESHQTFLEPEGLNTNLIYLQGISTSLPEDVQYQFLRTIPGLENVKIVRPGYAVEYDFIEPTQIHHTLKTRTIDRLFLAGQINGTSGYEEAAVQGFVAGINAAHFVLDREEFILNRDEAYIGVLIDDLVTKGTREPYRMMTSRAEHRLILREDNTLDRLAARSSRLGLLSEIDLAKLNLISQQRRDLSSYLKNNKIFPNQEMQEKLRAKNLVQMTKSLTLEEFLRRTDVTPQIVADLGFEMNLDPLVSEAVEIDVKYAGYVRRQQDLIEQSKKFEQMILPEDLVYKLVRGLSNEEVDKLEKVKPRTLGQAQRISGVNPSAIQAIMIHLKNRRSAKENSFESAGRSSVSNTLETGNLV